jgi:periplasmic protein TonB
MPLSFKQLSLMQRAILVSLLVHLLVLMVKVADPEVFKRVLEDSALDVVLVNSSSAEVPTKAQVIAQRNLAGGGDADKGRATSPLPPAFFNTVGEAFDETHHVIEQMQEQQLQLLAQVKRELATLPAPDPKRGQSKATPKQDEERRRQLLMQLAQIEKRINEENSRPKRRYISPAAREGVHALYYDALRHKIEELGTRNFPEVGGRKLYGELTVLVAVDALGRVVEVEVVRSSGNKLLDKRAVSIVRGAAPYGDFSPSMRSQFDQLVFVSRFRFTRDEGLRAAVEDAGSR